MLLRDLAGRRLPVPVLYPGSTERTSFAERAETKGTMMLEVDRGQVTTGGQATGGVVRWELRALPVPPMVEVELEAGAGAGLLTARLRESLARLDPRSVVRIRLRGDLSPEALPALRAEALRAAAPPTMHVSVAWNRQPGGRMSR